MTLVAGAGVIYGFVFSSLCRQQEGMAGGDGLGLAQGHPEGSAGGVCALRGVGKANFARIVVVGVSPLCKRPSPSVRRQCVKASVALPTGSQFPPPPQLPAPLSRHPSRAPSASLPPPVYCVCMHVFQLPPRASLSLPLSVSLSWGGDVAALLPPSHPL